MNFLAIDFETADYGADSACAVGLVRVESGVIVTREAHLIRPPRKRMHFEYVHGISWNDVKDKPAFAGVYPRMQELMEGVEFLVAHNARFDKGVLGGCCFSANIDMPTIPFKCTMNLARQVWNIRPTNLPAVCRHFGIRLNHHDATSDAEACAKIMIEVLKAQGKL
ncbi:MAG: exonuclease [Bacteroidetes bacterium]|nr:MAG: exonuclease [Bacteroidota bacterium]